MLVKKKNILSSYSLKKYFWIPESFNNTNIYHHFLLQKNLVNSQHKFKRVILYLKTGFKRSFERFLVPKNKSESKIYILLLFINNFVILDDEKYLNNLKLERIIILGIDYERNNLIC